MTLNFPNASLSYFFIEARALLKLMPKMKCPDADCLETFDASRERIFDAARRVY